jgi:hypothetical protein
MLARGAIMGVVASLMFAPLTGAGASARKAPSAAAFIRVDQLGYPAAAAKRAYLLSTVAGQPSW